MRRTRIVVALMAAVWLSGVASAQSKGELSRRVPVDPTAVPVVRTIAGTPLTVLVGDDASFQVLNTSVAGQGQIYPGTCTTSTGDAGVFIRHAGSIYSSNWAEHPCASFVSAGARGTPFTPVSISPVTGTGTAVDPYQVVVVDAVGTTGIQMTMTVRYVDGQNYFTKLLNFTSPDATSFDVFLGADLYLAGADSGVPYLETTSVSPGGQTCAPPTYTILLIPLTPAQHYSANGYGTIWAEIAAGTLSDSVAGGCIDNGAGLQWVGVNVPAGGSTSIQSAVSFGDIPSITQFNVDTVTPSQGIPGQVLNVTVTGLGFLAGTTFDFGAGITAGAPTINSSTSATVPLTIAANAALGFRNVTGTQSPGGLTYTLTNGFSVVAPPTTTIACANWLPEVGTWGPFDALCGDFTSTTTTAVYESASYLTPYSDFSYDVTLVATRPIQPTASNAIIVRGAPSPRGPYQAWDSGYLFGFTTTGKFSVFRLDGGKPNVVQAWASSPYINLGSGATNTLRVDANGGSLTFSINTHAVLTIAAQTLLSGQVGVGMVRSVPTTALPNDTLQVVSATVTPGGGQLKGVDAEQQKLNDEANRTTRRPDALFADPRAKW